MPVVSREWVIREIEKIKYCGYDHEQNYLYYEYEESNAEDSEMSDS
jgi:hypothetical protein